MLLHSAWDSNKFCTGFIASLQHQNQQGLLKCKSQKCNSSSPT